MINLSLQIICPSPDIALLRESAACNSFRHADDTWGKKLHVRSIVIANHDAAVIILSILIIALVRIFRSFSAPTD